jgi:acyl carrier protein
MLKQQVADCLSQCFNTPILVDDTSDLLARFAPDSLGVVGLISELETTFNCTLAIQNITDLQTLERITQAVANALASNKTSV